MPTIVHLKKILVIFMFLALLVLSSCTSSAPPQTDSPSSQTPSTSETPTPDTPPTVSETEPEPALELLEVFVDIEVTGEDGKPEFVIHTNLPDETVLSLELSLDSLPEDGQDYYFEQRELEIKNGTATAEVFSDGEEPLIGDYFFGVVMLPSEQPEQVRKTVGENGENLTGELVEKLDEYQYIATSLTYHSPYESNTTT